MTTAKQVMRKYKIAVGICGPTIMYSKVIKAATPEEAVEKYLADSEDEYTEAEKDMLLRHTIEIGIIKPKVKTKHNVKMPISVIIILALKQTISYNSLSNRLR